MKHIIIIILIIILLVLIILYSQIDLSNLNENFSYNINQPHDIPSSINFLSCEIPSLEPTQNEVITDKDNKRINLYNITRNNSNYKFIIQKDFKDNTLPVVQTYLESPFYKSSNIEDMDKYVVYKKDQDTLPLTLALKETTVNSNVNNFYGYNYTFN